MIIDEDLPAFISGDLLANYALVLKLFLGVIEPLRYDLLRNAGSNCTLKTKEYV